MDMAWMAVKSQGPPTAMAAGGTRFRKPTTWGKW